MKHYIRLIGGMILAIQAYQLHGQASPNDSLPLRILSEVMIQGVNVEDDKRLLFFKRSQSNTTEDILCHMSGVNLVRRGAYGQEPVIRGLSAGQINVTIDGMRMFGACTDRMDPVSIYVEPQNLNRINVAAGTTGSSLGSSVGGFLDFKLAEPEFSVPFRAVAGFTYSTVSDGKVIYAMINKAKKNQAFRFSSVYRKQDSYRAGDGNVVPYSQYEKLNLNASGKWAIQPGDTIKTDALADLGWNIGFPALPMDVGYARALIGAITWSHTRPDHMITQLITKAYMNEIHHEMDDTQRDDVAMHMDMPGKSLTMGIFTEGQFKLLNKHQLSFRADIYRNQSLAEMTMYPEGESPMYMQTWPSSHRTVLGSFIHDEWRLNQRTAIKFDARIDYAITHIDEGFGADQLMIFYPDMDLNRQQVAPSTNVSWLHFLSPDFQVTVQTGYAQRLPSLSEHAGFYLFNRMDGYDYIGNPELNNEAAWNTTMALNFWSKKFDVQVDLFNQLFRNYIFGEENPALSPMTPGANGVKEYINLDKVLMWGVETSLSWQPITQLKLINQTKFVYATIEQGDPLPLIPPFTSQLTIRYSWSDFNIQADNEWAALQNRINTGFGEDTTPSYYIANLRLEYMVSKPKLTYRIQAGLENIFNRFYHAHLDWGNIPRPGRNFYITLECRL